MDRKPAVAGRFYPGTEKSLRKELKRLLSTDKTPRKAICAIAPHAGYIYSGGIAGEVFSSVEVPSCCIILSPNHTGIGAKAALMTKGSWTIPTGRIPVNEEISTKLLSLCNDLKDDSSAHLEEHSLEVQLPFLLARQPGLTIVPITISHINFSACSKIAEAIAELIDSRDENILIVASTDMNHYEDQTHTLEKDRLAIERVVSLDPNGLLSTCAEKQISMCGVVPTAIAISASKKLGASSVTLIDHKTSGDISGDYNAVVGYAGFIIE
ncbi:MAG: AmmeMemoRadiSam system protein B [Deltaproteobacteria bacterium]|jgi:MEMO1 family protein|nr:AmmeMemoRadiSam system protein B [Deltaproteobacteria bacterium]